MKKMKYAIMTALVLSMSACSQTSTSSTKETKDETEEEKETETLDTSTLGTGEKYSNSEDGGHAILCDGSEDSYDNVSVEKTGESSGDEADFYGENAAVFATNGGTLTITSSKVDTNGSHANGIFSYGEGTTVNVSDTYITTTSNNSGGLMTTGGATMNASNCVVDTKGGSSAAIRSDRGGGTVVVDGGSYSSYGKGSPAIYSTADITVSNADLYSDISQAVVVEGKNSVTLNNVNATGKNTSKNSDNSDYYQAVMLYQSMSGDASQGQSTFTMKEGSLTSENEGMFFVTNTTAEINLEDVTLNYASDDLLRICAAGWGNEGQNGGQVTLNAKKQSLEGTITVDSVSNLNLKLNNSTFKGSIQNEGEVYVELKKGSTWTLTEDSSITSLTCDKDSIDLNGHTLTVNGKTYKEGTASTGEEIEATVYESTGGGGGAPGDGQTPPDKPDGEGGGQGGDGSEPPEKPDGEGEGQGGDGSEPPEKPE